MTHASHRSTGHGSTCAHSGKSARQRRSRSRGRSAAAIGTVPPLVRCDHCGVKVRCDRLVRHKTKVHPWLSQKQAVAFAFFKKNRKSVQPGPRRYSGAHCQLCGIYLTTKCFSKHRTGRRVPSRNKICPGCFRLLPPDEQAAYHEHDYAKGSVWVVNSGQTRNG